MFYVYTAEGPLYTLRFASLKNAKYIANGLTLPSRDVYPVICL